ncbi:ACT domain-containing protein [Allocoprobacillus halotolerans]|uniref:aspartate kinase n=1 Tax=Allocoprobacillus halotolerans TaxID=2944914 RepID=A0ABY5I4W7_9FIRM|nr:ACT domain-containing protein [Allocoprobacillus halotolerans]UTY40391.1 ACT domain-containing protein [Allocoprobacillus halotolerans]
MKLIESDRHIIQVKLMNVEKNSLFVGDIFQTISSKNVNIDMISEVLLEDEMRIDFTCSQDDQKNLDEALSIVRTKHPHIQIYQNRQVAKIKLESDAMKDEVGVAAIFFTVLGKHQIPLLQVTTSEVSISCVIPLEYIDLAMSEIKKEYK